MEIDRKYIKWKRDKNKCHSYFIKGQRIATVYPFIDGSWRIETPQGHHQLDFLTHLLVIPFTHWEGRMSGLWIRLYDYRGKLLWDSENEQDRLNGLEGERHECVFSGVDSFLSRKDAKNYVEAHLKPLAVFGEPLPI